MAAQPALREEFARGHPEDYKAVVATVVRAITADDYGECALDPERIHVIDDGRYQGTLVFVIAEKGYTPSAYWYCKVSYGSCSGCDTLQCLRGYDDGPPTAEQVDGYMTLALHIVQGLKLMESDE